tara:strand:+ start:26 stop:763 length:738 start_codon:yes stop_codon:yes gene_type:complete
MVAVATAIAISQLVLFAGKAIFDSLPNKELNRDLGEATKKADRGLSKGEENELAALLGAAGGSSTKANLNAVGEAMAGAGMISGADAIIAARTLEEEKRKSDAQKGRIITEADTVARREGQAEKERLGAQKDQAIASRNESIFNAAQAAAKLATTEYITRTAKNPAGDVDPQAALHQDSNFNNAFNQDYNLPTLGDGLGFTNTGNLGSLSSVDLQMIAFYRAQNPDWNDAQAFRALQEYKTGGSQ